MAVFCAIALGKIEQRQRFAEIGLNIKLIHVWSRFLKQGTNIFSTSFMFNSAELKKNG